MSKRAHKLGFCFGGIAPLVLLPGCGSDATQQPSASESAGGSAFTAGGTTGTSGAPAAGGTAGIAGGLGAGGPGAGGSPAGGTSAGGTAGAGAGGAAGSSGGVAATGGGAGIAGKPPCVSDSKQVVIIGDSYVTGFLGTPQLQPALSVLVPAAAQYRNYAVAGISLKSGGIPVGPPPGVMYIPQEFDPTAIAAGADIKLVIMDGGGNDVLLPPAGSPDCKNLADNTTNPGCTKIVKDAQDAATALVQHMADKGVKDVIFFFYPHLPSVSGGLGGTTSNQLLDYAYQTSGPLCDSATSTSGGKINCHFIDVRQPFESTGPVTGAGPWTNIGPDGVHPTAAGQTIIATQIANVMKAKCLGQPASSGCCAP